MKTPIGTIAIEEDGEAITALYIRKNAGDSEPAHETELLREAKRQLQEYFAGKRKTFGLPLHPQGTEFHKRRRGREQAAS